MFSALVYLRVTSLRNWLLSRLRRLRQPKYLAGAIVGCAYFYFFFFRPLGRNVPSRPVPPLPDPAHEMFANAAALPADWQPALLAFGTLALLVFLAFMWVVPTRRAALGFTEAEIAFLFPAPIRRSSLVHFRLLSAQLRSLVGAGVMMLFTHRWSALGGNALTHALGWWCIFSALNLHFSGASFTLTRLADLGLGAWRRRLLILAGIVLVFTVTILRLPAETVTPPLGAAIDLPAASAWLIALTRTAPLHWLLAPLRLVVAPFLALDVPQFLLALGPAAAVLLVHYLWVVRSAVAFEDAAIDHARRRTARIEAWRAGRRGPATTTGPGRRPPFPLGGTGRPELAFLWKNLLSTWPYFTLRLWLATAVLLVGVGLWLNHQPHTRLLAATLGASALMLAAYVLLIGPQFARQDLRSDLPQADLLKTYPLPGWQIVLGELLTPAIILTGVLWLALLFAAVAFQPIGRGAEWLTPGLRLAGGAGLALATPFVVLLQLLVPNAAALVFPGWFQLSRMRGGGPEVIGQRMIYFFAQVVAMTAALAPALLAGGAVTLMFHWITGVPAALALAALAAAAVLAAELWFGVQWLGRRFEKLDLAADLRP